MSNLYRFCTAYGVSPFDLWGLAILWSAQEGVDGRRELGCVGLAGVPQEGYLYTPALTGGAGLTTPPCVDRGTKSYAHNAFAVRFILCAASSRQRRV
jgi:hypothetical protein